MEVVFIRQFRLATTRLSRKEKYSGTFALPLSQHLKHDNSSSH